MKGIGDDEGRVIRHVRIQASDPHPFEAEIRHRDQERTAHVSVRGPHESVTEVPFDYRELAACIVTEIHRHAANRSMEEAARAAEAMMNMMKIAKAS
jgi:hypothetical protein